jgi:23S rRNA (uridine2552-2'-O)-methyltransferase
MARPMCAYNPKDYYFKKAKENNFKARSVFKLEELDQKYKLIKTGQRILDLGCSPGSWSQYAAQKVGPSGEIIGVDLKAVDLTLQNAKFFVGDVFDKNISENWGAIKFQIIMSDMAPSTTGNRFVDQTRSFELCIKTLELCDRWLEPHGHCVVKYFHGGDFSELKEAFLNRFEKFEAYRPKSTRQESKEIFLVGKHFQSTRILQT